MATNSNTRVYVVRQSEIPATYHAELNDTCSRCTVPATPARMRRITVEHWAELLIATNARVCAEHAALNAIREMAAKRPVSPVPETPGTFYHFEDTPTVTNGPCTYYRPQPYTRGLAEVIEPIPCHIVGEAVDVEDYAGHKQIFAEINATGEGVEGVTEYLSGHPGWFYGYARAGQPNLIRQLVEDVHLSASGDVLRNTGIDRDGRPYHLRPMIIRRDWQVDGHTAERIGAALTKLSADMKVAGHYRKAFAADPSVLVELESLARELEAETALPAEDALSGAARYYEDSNGDVPADDEPEVEGPEYQGADGGFTQYINLDDVRDEDYHQVQYVGGKAIVTANTGHPACPWSLKQPKHVQTIGRALNVADSALALRNACTLLLEAKGSLNATQAKVLWGIYFRTRERLHFRKYGQPSPKAIKFKARLENPVVAIPINFVAATVAIQQLCPGDRSYLTPILNKVQRRYQVQVAHA